MWRAFGIQLVKSTRPGHQDQSNCWLLDRVQVTQKGPGYRARLPLCVARKIRRGSTFSNLCGPSRLPLRLAPSGASRRFGTRCDRPSASRNYIQRPRSTSMVRGLRRVLDRRLSGQWMLRAVERHERLALRAAGSRSLEKLTRRGSGVLFF